MLLGKLADFAACGSCCTAYGGRPLARNRKSASHVVDTLGARIANRNMWAMLPTLCNQSVGQPRSHSFRLLWTAHPMIQAQRLQHFYFSSFVTLGHAAGDRIEIDRERLAPDKRRSNMRRRWFQEAAIDAFRFRADRKEVLAPLHNSPEYRCGASQLELGNATDCKVSDEADGVVKLAYTVRSEKNANQRAPQCSQVRSHLAARIDIDVVTYLSMVAHILRLLIITCSYEFGRK